MILRLFLFLCAVGTTYFGCNRIGLLDSVVQVELMSGDSFDLEAIGKILGDKRIVAIGESSHGIGDYYAFKSALVEYLHKKHGFEVLAFEAGLGDLNLAWNDIDSLSALELRNQTIFGNFQCKEIENLFRYIKTKSTTDRPLIYSGFDNQMSASYFIRKIRPILMTYDQSLGNQIDEKLGAYSRWYQAGLRSDSIAYYKEQQSYISTAQRIRSVIESNHVEIKSRFSLSDLDVEIIDRTCDGFARAVNVDYENKWSIIGLRDSIMFDNFQWLINEVYPNKKVIIWAHNGHIERAPFSGNSFKWMGHFLEESYGDDYYALGLFAKEGQSFRQWDRQVIDFDNSDSTQIEMTMMTDGHKVSFLDLSQIKNAAGSQWVSSEVHAFELENGGTVSFIPIKRFNGLITFGKVDAPQY